jgi:hypothetical protein
MALTDRQVTKVCPLNLEKFEDTKVVNRGKRDNTTAKGKKTKGQKAIYKTLDIKLKIANPTENRLRVLQKGQ